MRLAIEPDHDAVIAPQRCSDCGWTRRSNRPKQIGCHARTAWQRVDLSIGPVVVLPPERRTTGRGLKVDRTFGRQNLLKLTSRPTVRRNTTVRASAGRQLGGTTRHGQHHVPAGSNVIATERRSKPARVAHQSLLGCVWSEGQAKPLRLLAKGKVGLR